MAAKQQKDEYTGVWRCRYWYPSNTRPGEDVSEYYATIQQKGKELVMESLPNKEESYMFARMVVDGDLVTGTWHENTSPSGEFAGSLYSGAMQLLFNETNDVMSGKWVGIGQESGVRKIYTGKWELSRAGKN